MEEAAEWLNPAVWRLLDNDGFFVSNPGFEHCANQPVVRAGRRVEVGVDGVRRLEERQHTAGRHTLEDVVAAGASSRTRTSPLVPKFAVAGFPSAFTVAVMDHPRSMVSLPVPDQVVWMVPQRPPYRPSISMGQYASTPVGLFWSSAHLVFDVTQDLHVDPTFHFMWTPLSSGRCASGPA